MYIVYQLDNPKATCAFYRKTALQDAQEYAEQLAEKDHGNGGFVYVCKPVNAIEKTKVSYEHMWKDMD